MFGSNKKTVNNICQMETVIGRDTVIKGNISSKGTIRIDGQFEGDISTTGSIIVGESASITAQVKAINATIAGTVYGNVDVTEKLELLSSARIYGDIKVGALIISEGAILKGSCEMGQSAEQPAIEENFAFANP
ncbi:MAG: polymer-forming cytoskeletal protein [Sporomusaceae bacterium]|nr:polymer-forming cytoskeletal protein [Sporomusaceae bacterium]